MSFSTEFSLGEVVRGLASNKFSVQEVVTEYLSAVKGAAYLNAFITVAETPALQEAKRIDAVPVAERGVLKGAPIGVKDNILTRGLTTTAASKMLEHFVPPYDATVIERLKGAGGMVLGKTNLDEFAMGSSNENSAFGAVRNPWDVERVPGGTSGGSAAAVAARLVPAALGTDTGGSVRQPASFCGVLGLKPTYGRVSRYGVIAYASSLDQVGVLAHTTEDLALLLSIIGGHCRFDATSSRRPLFSAETKFKGDRESVAGLKVGLPKEYFLQGLDNEVSAAVTNTVAELEKLGAKVVDISLPHTEAAVAAYYIIAPAEASSNLSRYDGIRYGYRAAGVSSLKDVYRRTRTEGFGEEVKRRIMIGTYVLSSGYYEAFYRKAQQVRTLIARDFTQVFAADCDVIATPVAPTTAYKLGEKLTDPLQMYLGDIFTIPVSLAGLPALSIPGGLSSVGLPIGVQLIAPHFQEDRLLQISAALEPVLQWRAQGPQTSWRV